MHNIINNLKKIQNQIKDGIDAKLINTPTIIAVSKTFEMSKILPLIEYGHVHFGENKIQESLNKWPKIKQQYPNLKLHMLGKIQTNKSKHLFPLFDYIHSLDNLKLAKIISKLQENEKIKPKIFIQVNIGNEIQKNGIDLESLNSFYNECSNNLGLDIIGFMCLPPSNKNPSKYFKLMEDLIHDYNLNDLSMGMSGDYLEAIKYKSTYLRIGSSIFGSRD